MRSTSTKGLVAIVSVIGVTMIEVVALFCGVNGTALAGSIGALSALAGGCVGIMVGKGKEK